MATAFSEGKKHDFKLFKESGQGIVQTITCLADSGYQGMTKIHKNSQTPKKKSKHHPLTKEEKAVNRALAKARIYGEHVIGKLKIFRILKERYRNRRKRFGLRFNLIASIYNLSLELKWLLQEVYCSIRCLVGKVVEIGVDGRFIPVLNS